MLYLVSLLSDGQTNTCVVIGGYWLAYGHRSVENHPTFSLNCKFLY